MQSVKRGLRASEHHGKTQYRKTGESSNVLNYRQISKREKEKAGGKQVGSTKLSRQENKKEKKWHSQKITKSYSVRIKLSFISLLQYENSILKHN